MNDQIEQDRCLHICVSAFFNSPEPSPCLIFFSILWNNYVNQILLHQRAEYDAVVNDD